MQQRQGDIDPETGFPWEWEHNAAWFIYVANASDGIPPDVNNAESNWYEGIRQLQAGSWRQPWGGHRG
jgi:hypothetical protein